MALLFPLSACTNISPATGINPIPTSVEWKAASPISPLLKALAASSTDTDSPYTGAKSAANVKSLAMEGLMPSFL